MGRNDQTGFSKEMMTSYLPYEKGIPVTDLAFQTNQFCILASYTFIFITKPENYV